MDLKDGLSAEERSGSERLCYFAFTGEDLRGPPTGRAHWNSPLLGCSPTKTTHLRSASGCCGACGACGAALYLTAAGVQHGTSLSGPFPWVAMGGLGRGKVPGPKGDLSASRYRPTAYSPFSSFPQRFRQPPATYLPPYCHLHLRLHLHDTIETPSSPAIPLLCYLSVSRRRPRFLRLPLAPGSGLLLLRLPKLISDPSLVISPPPSSGLLLQKSPLPPISASRLPTVNFLPRLVSIQGGSPAPTIPLPPDDFIPRLSLPQHTPPVRSRTADRSTDAHGAPLVPSRSHDG
ncbi:hypothetical protein G7Z17_g5187 [Cylindrodendrum hubeiense]|uniref:Uncharacterized protein n=1 Tax=Cylindrodendrum hubeiense TaxID=595255 RepID=A0A9P5L9B0_9HYPO|nr:hypothetical protein G7Z17_g5187 [Cylindrodendrum hubeiense]